MQCIFCTLAMLQATTREGALNNAKMQKPVSGMHTADSLIHRRSQDFKLGERTQTANHMQ